MSDLIQLRRGSSAAWTAANPILNVGEPGVELDTGKQKIGDGSTSWSDLPYTADFTGDPEFIRDTIAAALSAGSNVTVTPNDGADTITISASTDPEVVRDTIGTALTAGTGITVTPNDGADTITIAVSGLTDSSIAPVTPNDQTGTTYTFVLNDKHKVVTGNNAAAQTFTIPPNSSVAYPLGTSLQVYQKGAGQITMAAGAGVTLRIPRGAKTAVQYAFAQVVQVATDVWAVSGDVTT